MDAKGFYRQMLNQLAVDHKTDLSVLTRSAGIDFKNELLHGTGSRSLAHIYQQVWPCISYESYFRRCYP